MSRRQRRAPAAHAVASVAGRYQQHCRDISGGSRRFYDEEQNYV